VEFSAATRNQAMESLHQRLRELHSPLADNPETIDQLRRQLNAILDDVSTAGGPATAPDRPTVNLSREIGTARATSGVHPVESVRAAIEMFQILLPIVMAELRARGADDAVLTATVGRLHGSIMRRVGLGAVFYASHLLNQVNDSHRNERHRIARELHDRAAHAIGVALQDIELHQIYERDDPDRAGAVLVAAKTALHEASASVRHTARELRDASLERGGLAAALDDYIAAHVPGWIEVTSSVTGEVDALPNEVCDELYIVIREALRNAVRHAASDDVEVRVEVAKGSATATVRDHGTGFDADAELISPSGIGLLSIRERVDLLYGNLSIVSAKGTGTTITIDVHWPVSPG
jgi:signal transduction histidine kinase